MFKKVEDTLTPIADGAQGMMQDPAVLSMLLGGLGTGAVGGYLSSRGKGHAGEDQKQRRKRILMNALLAGTAGAAAGGLAGTAYKSLSNALPEGDVDPTTQILSPALRIGAAGGAGALLHRSGVKEEEPGVRRILNVLRSRASEQPEDRGLKSLSAEIEGAIGDSKHERVLFEGLHQEAMKGGLPAPLQDAFNSKAVRAAGGINEYDVGNKNWWYNPEAIGKGGIRDVQWNKLFQDTGLGRLGQRILGRTTGDKILRGGALGAALLTPEIIGSLMRGVTGHE
jgi:hypothetical protein